jgi:RNA-splicing ligase RtcB
MSTKDEYIATMKAQLDEWGAQIDALEAKADEIRQDARENYEEQLSALRIKRMEGEQNLKEMRLASETAWADLKAETENVRMAFMDAARAFQAHFKS